MNSYEYMCVHAVIDLGTKLDEQGSLPIDAMNYMAQRNAPTGAMEIYIFHTIEKYHPRGAEMRQRWKEYCDSVYGHT